LIGMALQARPQGIRLAHAFALIRRTACFENLSWESFLDVGDYVATSDLHESARVDAKLFLEEVAGTSEIENQKSKIENSLLLPLRKSLAGLYAQNVGTITQEGQVNVRVQGGAIVGSIEEAFA